MTGRKPVQRRENVMVISDLGGIRLPEKAVRAQKIKSLAMRAPTAEVRDAVLLNGLLGLVADLEAELAARTE